MPETKYKVAMITRPNLFSAVGGDSIQVLKTAEFLQKNYPVTVDIVLNKESLKGSYHLFHFFNVICPEDILGYVLTYKTPYVVSTIFQDYREFDRYHRRDLLGLMSKILGRNGTEYIKNLAKLILKGETVSSNLYFIYGHRNSIRYIIKHAALLLPNSENEYKRLSRDYNISKTYRVVPNSIDVSIFHSDSNLNRELIVCAARIEGNKNQLNVIRALKDTQYPIVFIGAPAPNQHNYYKQCLKEASENMRFINHLPQEELKAYYAKAKVHILASWFETTGLSSLEAGAMGCNLVIGNRGDVKDYFSDEVFYCEPGSLSSIREAVDKAWNHENDGALQKRIKENYTWEHTARVTMDAYKEVLEKEYRK